jgi:hypothetical protein
MTWDGTGGQFWTSPDLSVTVTEREAFRAFRLFDRLDWDAMEAKGLLPVDRRDALGVPMDRHNRNIRLAFMAECMADARDAEPGTGLDLMENRYWRFAVEALLEARDRAHLDFGLAP